MAEESLAQCFEREEPATGLAFASETVEDALLSGGTFRECRFTDCSFDYTTLQQAKFLNCRFDNCSFKETVFEDCTFVDGETGSIWRYCDLSKASVRRSNISLNQFIGCEAYQLTLEESAGQGAKFDLQVHRKIASKTIKGGVSADRCKLQYAEFTPSDLAESHFEGCDLRDASFAGCDLSHASLRGSAINSADLSGATLDGANLAHATFDEIDLAAMASHHGLVVSRDQHETILISMGVITLD